MNSIIIDTIEIPLLENIHLKTEIINYLDIMINRYNYLVKIKKSSSDKINIQNEINLLDDLILSFRKKVKQIRNEQNKKNSQIKTKVRNDKIQQYVLEREKNTKILEEYKSQLIELNKQAEDKKRIQEEYIAEYIARTNEELKITNLKNEISSVKNKIKNFKLTSCKCPSNERINISSTSGYRTPTEYYRTFITKCKLCDTQHEESDCGSGN